MKSKANVPVGEFLTGFWLNGIGKPIGVFLAMVVSITGLIISVISFVVSFPFLIPILLYSISVPPHDLWPNEGWDGAIVQRWHRDMLFVFCLPFAIISITAPAFGHKSILE